MKTIEKIFFFDQSSRYKEIEGLRAIAVILVFNVHFFIPYGGSRNGTIYPFLSGIISFLQAGQLGVDIFFVISGFLIWKILFIKRTSPIEYLKGRFIRLMPAYVSTILLIFIYKKIFSTTNIQQLAINLFFLPTFIKYFEWYNYVAWSLGWEWVFYILLLVVWLLPIKSSKVKILVSILLSAVAVFSPKPNIIKNLDIRFMSFFLGCLVAEYSDDIKANNIKYLSIPTLPAIIGLEYIWSQYSARISLNPLYYCIFYLSAGGCAMILLLSIVKQSCAYKKVLCTIPLRIIGQISYSFYLTHAVFGIPLGNKIVSRFFPSSSYEYILLVYFIDFFLSFTIGTLFFYFFERPYFVLKYRDRQLKKNILDKGIDRGTQEKEGTPKY